ncbi:MAG: hypothetical protein ACRD22_20610 [Terriglobia bacterium]
MNSTLALFLAEANYIDIERTVMDDANLATLSTYMLSVLLIFQSLRLTELQNYTATLSRLLANREPLAAEAPMAPCHGSPCN